MKKVRILIAIVSCIACLALLAGCSSSKDSSADAQTQNRQYMTSVNQIMSDLNTAMGEFSTDVKGGEVLSLTGDLSAVDEAVNKLKALQAPDDMQSVNKDYIAGAEELQTALKLYTQLYQDEKLKASSTDYTSRLAEVQSHYDAGIAKLKSADQAVSQA